MQRRITAGYARRRGRSANRSWRVILCCFQVAQIRLFRSSLRVTKLNTPSVLSNKAKITKCCNRRSARAETARVPMPLVKLRKTVQQRVDIVQKWSEATRRLGAKRCDAGCRRALLQRGVLGPAARAARRPDDQATQDGVPALLADADPGVVHGGHLHGEARHRDGGKGPARTGVIRRSGSAFAETGGSERARDARRAPGRHRAPSRRLPGRALALAPLLQRCAVQPLIGRRLRAATLSLPRSIA